MSVIFIVLPLALLVGALGVGACIWATRRGQFDDMETPAIRVIVDDDVPSLMEK
jgi:cbb3-type cytochrome oxidase maturation protein